MSFIYKTIVIGATRSAAPRALSFTFMNRWRLDENCDIRS